jgi:hypothetical protein
MKSNTGDTRPGARRPTLVLLAGSRWQHALAVAALSVATAAQPHAAQAQGVQLVIVDVKAVATVYRTSTLKGTDVRNDQKEKIGDIDEVIVMPNADDFVIIQVGGFLGLGGHLIATPFKSLKIDETGRNIVLPGASKEALKKLPEFKYAK